MNNSTEHDRAATSEERYAPFPFTDLQQAYWIGQTDLMELGRIFAHIYTEIEFTALDLQRVSVVIQRLIERHDTLRTVVLPDGTQRVLPTPCDYEIPVTDFRGQDEHAILAQLEAIRQRMRQHGPTTDTWPLWDVRASLLAENRMRLHMSVSLLIVDGRSMAILSAEAIRLYQSPEAMLPPVDVTFRDCVTALHTREQTAPYRTSADYWKRRLATLPPGPELPLTKRPADLQETRFVSHAAHLTAHTWQRLKELALRQGLRSPIAVLYAAYAEALTCWSKTPHFTITVLFAHRLSQQQAGARDVVGNLSTTILLEVDNTVPDSFIARAKRLERQLWHDLAHSDVCGVQVIREMAQQQGWSSQALVPVAFASTLGLSAPDDKSMFRGAQEQGKVIDYGVQTPQVYLDHQIYETCDGLRIEWDMVDELFPEGLPDEMLTAYCQLLGALADDEARWRQPAASVTPPQQVTGYDALNATAAPLSGELLHTLVRKQADQRPAQPAVISGKRTVTYAQLDRWANAVGGWLREAGARPNTLVAVVMEKGWEQVVATLGVEYAGAAYLPIDPTLPRDRLWYLLEQGQVRHVLTQPWIDERLRWPPSITRFRLDDATLNALPYRPLTSRQTPDDLAYVIYTSGSTGLPKGVMITHRGVVNSLADINQRFAVNAADRVLALSSLSFDLSVYDIFGILAAGGALVLPDADAALDPAHWLQLLTEHRVTIWNTVPALMDLLTEYVAGHAELFPRSLRLALLSGDWIPLQLPEKLGALHEDLRVVSLGGATEASIWSIAYPIETVEPGWTSIPYGRPLRNQHVYVLDAHLNHRPHWALGHLYIGGVGLARGYWRDDAKTTASFITNPRTGERLYRTGDLGRYRPDGTIEFSGREDFQVKVQGYRIELGEIEAILRQHPAVREAIAAVEENARTERRLIAYVVPEHEQQPCSADLLAHVRARLPAYMIPAAVGVLDALPLTANGKVNRHALPAVHGGDAPRQTPYVAPRTDIEQRLVRLWEIILARQPVGVTDNFFELGGNSLAALRLMVRIRQQFHQDLPVSLLFDGATVERLAHALQRSSPSTARQRSPLVAIQSNGARPIFFCVHPVGGNVLCYGELSRHMGDAYPFYALEAPGVQGELRPYSSVVEMAASYKEAMRAVQPAGPYLLGGWSMGGVVAVDIAQQLRGDGEEVALVALIDSGLSTPAEREATLDSADLVAWFAKDLWRGAGKRVPFTKADLQMLQPDERIAYVLEQARDAHILAPEVDAEQIQRLITVFDAHTRALLSYEPHAYPHRAVLFAAEDTLAAYAPDRTLGWGEAIGSALTVVPVAGNHYSLLLQPSVRQLAESIRQYIDHSIKAHSHMR